MMGGGTHSCFGCGQNFVVDIDPRTGKWWGTTGLCKHLRPQLRKDYDGMVCHRYYRANGLYNTNKRAPPLCGGTSKHSKRPRVDEAFASMHGLANMPNCPERRRVFFVGTKQLARALAHVTYEG